MRISSNCSFLLHILLIVILLPFSGKGQFNELKDTDNCTTCRCCHQKLCHIYFDWQHLWWIHRLYYYWILLLNQREFCQSKMVSPKWTLLYWYLCGSLVHHLFSFWLCLVGLPTCLDTRYSDFFGSWWDRIENMYQLTVTCMHCVVVKSKIM